MDIVGAFLASLSRQAGATPALAFAAGVAGSVGPCFAARAASLTGLTSGARGVRRLVLVATFVVGIVASYVLIASSATLWFRIAMQSSWIYGALAFGLLIYGARGLARSNTHECCGATMSAPAVRSIGCAFLSGASFAFVASPCCTPVLVAIAGVAAKASSPFFAAAVAAAFAIGHGMPLTLLTCRDSRICGLLHGEQWRRAASVVGGGVMVALAGYYALLA
ncbi:MAG TPA: cytochrome c biogenesis protein CcdA [Candidatus Dormibacteraeota bacterium]|nr:cytochrome c biogenesis protein CcdA [Candidatus Dormibacteraeota bacterium]